MTSESRSGRSVPNEPLAVRVFRDADAALHAIADAARTGRIVAMLVPDEAQPELCPLPDCRHAAEKAIRIQRIRRHPVSPL